MLAQRKKCSVCGGELPWRHGPNAKYCSEECRRKAHRQSSSALEDKKKRRSGALSISGKRYRDIVYGNYDSKCAVCGWTLRPNKGGWSGGNELHHIVPISKGGTNDESNLILLCPNCHKSAHSGSLDAKTLSSKVVAYANDDEREIAIGMRIAAKYFKLL